MSDLTPPTYNTPLYLPYASWLCVQKERRQTKGVQSTTLHTPETSLCFESHVLTPLRCSCSAAFKLPACCFGKATHASGFRQGHQKVSCSKKLQCMADLHDDRQALKSALFKTQLRCAWSDPYSPASIRQAGEVLIFSWIWAGRRGGDYLGGFSASSCRPPLECGLVMQIAPHLPLTTISLHIVPLCICLAPACAWNIKQPCLVSH